METTNVAQQKAAPITLNISDIIQQIGKGKWIILICSLIFTAIGVLYAMSIPNEYNSDVKLLPELESKDVGGMSKFKSLAGLAGVDLGSLSSSEAVRPDLYPNIIQSTPFILEVMKLPVYVSKTKKTMVLSDYLNEVSKSGWMARTFGSSEEKEDKTALKLKASDVPANTLFLNKKQELILKNIQKRVSASLDKKTGVITMSAKMPDPVVAAVIARFTQDYLTKYVVTYRTEKTKKDIAFLESRVSEVKRRYDAALYNYSSYQDRNRNLFLNVARDEGKKLQYEVDLSYNLYSELTKQLEEAKIKIRRDTPIFKVLEPAQIPLKKSEPKRAILVVGFLIFGLFLSTFYVIIKNIKLSQLLG
ncbi:MAG: Wzz/FepE/Etk N-terminal domain-containing protein [Flectobacillus sp.]|nr:Wzz/FepE/Etk N-terminal domain-containing protein [Flectobacillus sp.]